jgi:hypothetical protein
MQVVVLDRLGDLVARQLVTELREARSEAPQLTDLVLLDRKVEFEQFVVPTQKRREPQIGNTCAR